MYTFNEDTMNLIQSFQETLLEFRAEKKNPSATQPREKSVGRLATLRSSPLSGPRAVASAAG